MDQLQIMIRNYRYKIIFVVFNQQSVFKMQSKYDELEKDVKVFVSFPPQIELNIAVNEPPLRTCGIFNSPYCKAQMVVMEGLSKCITVNYILC